MEPQGDMSSSKRSIDCDTDEAERKKVKKSNDNLGDKNDQQDKNGMSLDCTQGYSLDSSDGFELIDENTHSNKTNIDDIKDETDAETISKLQRKETEKYTPYNEHATEKEQPVPETNLKKIVSVQKDAELIVGIIPGINVDQVYEYILRRRKMNNRVDFVTNEIMESNENGNADVGSSDSSNSNDDKIFEEVAKVLVVRPKADPNRVFNLLEKLNENENRVETVLAQLTQSDDLLLGHDSGLSSHLSETSSHSEKSFIAAGKDPFSDPAFRSNPLYKDLKTLRKVLPETDPNEIYAFLEAHYDKPNRVQVVIDELTKSDSQESLPVQALESLEDMDRGKAPLTATDKFQADLKALQEIFRDCDPNFLYEKLDMFSEHIDRVQKIAAELFEHKNYPKLKDVKEKEKKEEFKNKVKKMEFDMTSFLKKFPKPVEYFSDTSRGVSQNYKDHAIIYMKNAYPYLKDGYIKKVLEGQSYHLAPTVKQVDQELPVIIGRPSKKKRANPRSELDYPENPDEHFFQEVIFCQHKQEIRDFMNEQTHLRNIKVEAAKEHGELLECGCCYDDECLLEEMAACADGHIFCKECVRRSSEAAIGEGKTKFLCLTGSCELEFPLAVLQELLPATTFSLALRKMQEEELRLADIPDLVNCPFCSFATIMPDQEDKVFKCLNPECLKESCRLCKEPNHIPLRCNEVEKQGATNMRTYIEMKVSEAMLRICPKCKKRFFKLSGCNKMTCTCGTTMCYVCRKPNIDYNHFENGCPIDSDVLSLHDMEMEAAANKAKEEYLREHPEQNPELDTEKLLSKLKQAWENERGDFSDDDDDDDDGYDGDYD